MAKASTLMSLPKKKYLLGLKSLSLTLDHNHEVLATLVSSLWGHLQVPGDEREGPQKNEHRVLSFAGKAGACSQAWGSPKGTPSLAKGFCGCAAGVDSCGSLPMVLRGEAADPLLLANPAAFVLPVLCLSWTLLL